MENAVNKLSLKLLIDNQSDKVLFGEASKDVVDFIFSFLALPLGAANKLLAKDATVGSIGEVYHNLSKVNEILSSDKVSSLLKAPPPSPVNRNTNFLLPPSTYQGTKLYVCPSTTFHYNNGNNSYASEVKGTRPNCGLGLNREAKFVDTESNVSVVEVGSDGKGHVKGVVTYSLMDDLTVVPMSTISSTALLNKFQIKDLGFLEEKTVTIGFEEVSTMFVTPN
ncbi:uncharacterized protein LOC144563923 [Carex rostrata]